MGSNVKFLMALNGRFWRRRKLAPTVLSEGPIHLTWEATDNQKTQAAAMVAFSGGPAADTCRGWTAIERNDRYLAALQPVYRDLRASFVKARFMDWPSDPWVKGRRTRSPRTGTGDDDAAVDGTPDRKPAVFCRRAHVPGFRRLHGRRAAVWRPSGQCHPRGVAARSLFPLPHVITALTISTGIVTRWRTRSAVLPRIRSFRKRWPCVDIAIRSTLFLCGDLDQLGGRIAHARAGRARRSRARERAAQSRSR